MTRASRWRAGTRTRGGCCGTWALGSLAVTALLLTADLDGRRDRRSPTRSCYDYPGVTRAATLHDFGFLLYRNGLVLALHALACVAGFIAGSQLPTAAQDYTGVVRRLHERRGPGGDRLRRRRDAVLARHPGLRARQQRRRRWPTSSGITPFDPAGRAAAARAARAVRALPPARRLVDRQPARRLQRAAGGHLRHDRDRDPAAAAGRRHRDLDHAEPPAARLPGSYIF